MPDYAVFTLRFSIFALAHSLFATNRLKQAASPVKGREPRFYRLLYNVLSTVAIIWVMSAWRNSPVIYFIPGITSLVMYFVQALVAAMLFSAVRQTGVAFFLGLSQLKAQAREIENLVTYGWYSVVRHPLYLLTLIFMILNPVMTAQWLLLIGLSFIYFMVGALIEEKRLQLRFGEQYDIYRSQVPFLVPSCRRNPSLSESQGTR